jgi:mRNA-degrading endonuclease toxin of MazEF toxin-antitoxin module
VTRAKRGEIWMADLGVAAKVRPVLVLSVAYEGLVSSHSFGPLRSGQRRIGSNSGATSTSMRRAFPGFRRISPVRSRVNTI